MGRPGACCDRLGMPSPASISPRAPGAGVSIIVDEVLSAVLAPARKDSTLGEALEMAELDAIPEQPTSLRIFVEGALFATLARHLEVSDALELVAQIRASLELALDTAPDERPTSDIRGRMRLESAPTRVLVVTQASLVVFLLQDVLGDEVEVMPIDDQATLRDRLRRLAGQPLLVVVDRKHPCAGPGVCELLGQELDASSTVVWWGAQGAELSRVERLLRNGPRVVPCPFDVQLVDLGGVCRRLLGV